MVDADVQVLFNICKIRHKLFILCVLPLYGHFISTNLLG